MDKNDGSMEVEFEGAYAQRCDAEGEGVKTIIGMVQLTRLDCVTGSLGIMQGALRHAVHHTRYRTVFQKKLADHPLMQMVLGDLALEIDDRSLELEDLAIGHDGLGHGGGGLRYAARSSRSTRSAVPHSTAASPRYQDS